MYRLTIIGLPIRITSVETIYRAIHVSRKSVRQSVCIRERERESENNKRKIKKEGGGGCKREREGEMTAV